jgi:hypothetical protein
MTPIAPHIETFLREHLGHHRGASPHIPVLYAYSFQLLFEFAAKNLKVAPSAVKLEQLDAALISAFLSIWKMHGKLCRHSKHLIGAIRPSFASWSIASRPHSNRFDVLAIPFKRLTLAWFRILQNEVQALV